MSVRFDVAVLGATGAVGEVMLSLLAERRFSVGRVYALASSRSAGAEVAFGDEPLTVEDAAGFDFAQVQLCLFSAGASVSSKYAPKATAAGCIVVDNTSKYRYEDDIPLVVPEVNPDMIGYYKNRGIIANPNCSTIQMVVALKPIYDAVGIERVNVCTYQSVSGSGKKAVQELASQTAALLNGKPVDPEVFPVPIAFNVLPHIDGFQDNGYTKEEMKMVWETQKILGDDTIRISPTTVRVPVFYGHSEAVQIETREKLTAEAARELLAAASGIEVVDEHRPGGYPTVLTHSAGRDGVFVGRIREDIAHPRGLNLWVVSDNVRKGAALNSVQIAEHLVKDYL